MRNQRTGCTQAALLTLTDRKRTVWLGPGRGAFTLVELMVVVTIIVILLALLTPSMEKAMEMAERVVCGANLHAFGTGHHHYATDNRNRLMSIPNHYSGSALAFAPEGLRYPNFVWIYNDIRAGEFSVEAIRPYIGEADQPRLGKMWLCPSGQFNYMREANDNFRMQQPRGSAPFDGNDGWFVDTEYAYFGSGGVEPERHVTRRSELASGRAGSAGVLMADTVLKLAPGSEFDWMFNHGVYQRYGGPPMINGINRVMGDGSSIWQPWTPRRAAAAWNVGPKDDMGDFVSALGQAQLENLNPGDGLTFY